MEFEKLNPAAMDLAADEYDVRLPYLKRMLETEAVLINARFEALKKEGFTEEQALEIVKARGSQM